MYTQCTLERVDDSQGEKFTVTKVVWLPVRFGKVGKVVKLKDDGESYAVTAVHGRMTGSQLAQQERDARGGQRGASDI